MNRIVGFTMHPVILGALPIDSSQGSEEKCESRLYQWWVGERVRPFYLKDS